MTRKDYIAIAEALVNAEKFAYAYAHFKPAHKNEYREGIMAAAEHIANAMQDDNPRFDREHFLAVVRGERELQSRPKRDRDTNRRANAAHGFGV